MKRAAILCLAAFALSACQQDTAPQSSSSEPSGAALPTASPSAEPSSPAVAEPATATPNPATAPATLEGEYRIAGVDGESIDLPFGITASITADRIRVSSQCVTFTWSYSYSDGAISTQPARAISCQRGLYPPEEAIEAAFNSATEVRITDANGYEFTGGGRSVTLFTQ